MREQTPRAQLADGGIDGATAVAGGGIRQAKAGCQAAHTALNRLKGCLAASDGIQEQRLDGGEARPSQGYSNKAVAIGAADLEAVLLVNFPALAARAIVDDAGCEIDGIPEGR